MESGNVDHTGGNGRPSTSVETIEQVRQLFQDDSSLSIRAASAQLGIPRSTVHRILHKCLFLFPYKLQNLQDISEADKEKRLEFAHHCSSHSEGYSEYLSRIVFSDECMFRINGVVNKQNVRIWGTERPEEINPIVLNSPGVMTWCAISKGRIIGPYFFENENVTGETYRSMLIRYAFPRFRELREDFVFQQDGAPPHYSNRVRAYLDRKVPDRWIGRGGPISWPPRSPDLTPCDFFLWGHIKSKIYSTPIDSIEDLKIRIRAEINSINQETLQKVWENMKLRLNYIKQQNGGHIENILN